MVGVLASKTEVEASVVAVVGIAAGEVVAEAPAADGITRVYLQGVTSTELACTWEVMAQAASATPQVGAPRRGCVTTATRISSSSSHVPFPFPKQACWDSC